MRTILVALAALWTGMPAGGAAAQTPNPVVEHYRAYLAALEAGDGANAERAAAAALAASEARDGDGGRTAVLAMNLALLRLDLGRGADAVAPAARAEAIAAAIGPDSGVDPLAATLTRGRAQLAAGQADAAATLRDALERARNRADLAEPAYEAAMALAEWAFAGGRFRTARDAFEDAEAHVGAAPDPDFAGAVVRVGRGASMLMMSDNARRALTMIDDAATTLRRYSNASTPSSPQPGLLTEAEFAYATALAWRSAAQGVLYIAGQSDPTWRPTGLDPASAFAPGCDADIIFGGVDPLPPSTLRQGGVSAAVLLLETDAAGEVARRSVVASAPSDATSVALQRDLAGWDLRWANDAPASCRANRRLFVVYVMQH